MNLLTQIFLCLTLTASLFARAPSWLDDRLREIDSVHSLSPDAQIDSLGQLVRIGQSPMDDTQRIVFKKAQTALLPISGHAEYYRDKILYAQERAKTIGPYALSDYSKEIMYGFQTFPHLSSPEGVRVLGEMLSNDWVPPGNETAALSEKFVPLWESATVTLPKFPLLDKPFRDPITRHNVSDARAAWQLWYEQIKAGNRTFRFEGDPTEYDFNGPASKELVQRVERDRKRDDERAAGHKKASTSSEIENVMTQGRKPSSIAWLVAIIGLGGAAVWYFLKGRKVA